MYGLPTQLSVSIMYQYKIFSLLSSLLVVAVCLPLVACANSTDKKEASIASSSTGYDSLKEERDFQGLAKVMKEKKLPLLVEFHADGCPYCSLLEEDFLNLMIGTAEYDNKIIIRQLKIDSGDTLIDFDGRTITTNKFAERYKAYMTPTMVFLNARGEEVAEKIVGINTPSLFSAYIDIEIKKALNNVRAENPSQKGGN